MKRAGGFILLLCVALLCGCETAQECTLTGRLWSTQALRQYCEPAPNADLRLYSVTNSSDILVEYSELPENAAKARSRTYLLHRNADRIAAGKRPVFVKQKQLSALTPLPLQEQSADVDRTNGIVYAVSTNQTSFTVYRNGKADGSYDLPVYLNHSGRPTQVLLTPLTVAGDATIIGIIAGLIWASTGGPAEFTN